MRARKQHRSSEDEADLVVVEVGVEKFTYDLIVARLTAEGVRVGSWGNGMEARYGVAMAAMDGGDRLLVQRDDLPSVEAAMADAGIA